jgi:hypothetical protein
MPYLNERQKQSLNEIWDAILQRVGYRPEAMAGPFGDIFDSIEKFSRPATNTRSGAGACGTVGTTYYASTGAGQALTLADGTVIGQRARVMYKSEGAGADTGIITPTNRANYASVTLNAVRDWVEFEWNGTAWEIAAIHGTATVA